MATQKSRTKSTHSGPELPEFSEAIGIEELWQFGYPLKEAWYFFASEYERNQFRESTSAQRSAALQKMMRMELQSKVAADVLVCLAIPIPAPLDGMPVRIPATVFESGAVDWEREELASLGRRFGAMRILKRGASSVAAEPSRSRPPIGRPSLNREIDQAIGELKSEGSFEHGIKKQMMEQVRVRARATFPGRFGPRGPSLTKIKERLRVSGL